ncbi:lysosomal cobalamin transporter ABCD4-like isoform X2 [Crassostrea virginica]|uniref:ATP-binding cassette sub-family D member 4-like isoform X2 n=1 Tax=Crassostrea virginica TaxID=6565 RepID=A0A8B8E2C9_CRAVI|nr:ATP-binding cassette sub-family D member 4-like isoform X2 [Crassostrea virginica]
MDSGQDTRAIQHERVFGLLFFKRFLKLAGYMFPSWRSVQLLICILLLILGLLDQVVIFYIGNIPSKYYKVFGDRDMAGFQEETIMAALLITAEALIKASSVYLVSVLYIKWRGSINARIHKLYFTDLVYYDVNTSGKIDNPDQRITQNLDRMCHNFSQIFAPIIIAPFTIAYYLYKSVESTSYIGPVGVLCFFLVATVINKVLMSPVVNFVFKRQEMEGNYRFKHMLLRTNAESAAFYRSGEIEKFYTDQRLHRLLKTQHSLILRQYPLNFSVNLFDYLGSVLSYILLAFPIFHGDYDSKSPADFSSLISANSFVIMYLINCFTRLIDLSVKAAEVAGNAHRVGELIEELQKIKDKQRTLNYDKDIRPSTPPSRMTQKALTVTELTYGPPKSCDILCKNLTFQLEAGVNILVTGDSGCGKSSLLRVIAGLWPSTHGSVKFHEAVNPSKILFLPQKPYFTDGTLKQQVIYPLKEMDYGSVSMDDESIHQYMELTGLQKLTDRSLGLENYCCNDWYQELSPGEMQRLSFVRLFFHQPRFAVLDEATSQIGVDLERVLYGKCRELGITVMSVGHRESLRQFHQLELRLQGRGNWTIQPITDSLTSS